jgi:hypothetical protein
MYNVTGQIINVFKNPANEKYEASWKLQLLGDSPLVDGQIKKEMLTLTIPKPIYEKMVDRIGEVLTLPIGFYVKNNILMPFYPKNAA